MDRDTLLHHRQHCGIEPRQESRDLPRLTQVETELYDDLRFNRFTQNLRLEQERVSFSFVRSALRTLII